LIERSINQLSDHDGDDRMPDCHIIIDGETLQGLFQEDTDLAKLTATSTWQYGIVLAVATYPGFPERASALWQQTFADTSPRAG
jgi:hypothetical protein